jgi:hypothetical protein
MMKCLRMWHYILYIIDNRNRIAILAIMEYP